MLASRLNRKSRPEPLSLVSSSSLLFQQDAPSSSSPYPSTLSTPSTTSGFVFPRTHLSRGSGTSNSAHLSSFPYEHPPHPLVPRKNAHRRSRKITLRDPSKDLEVQLIAHDAFEPTTTLPLLPPSNACHHPSNASNLAFALSSTPQHWRSTSLVDSPAGRKVKEILASCSPSKLASSSRIVWSEAIEETRRIIGGWNGDKEEEEEEEETCRSCEAHYRYGSCANVERICAWRMEVAFTAPVLERTTHPFDETTPPASASPLPHQPIVGSLPPTPASSSVSPSRSKHRPRPIYYVPTTPLVVDPSSPIDELSPISPSSHYHTDSSSPRELSFIITSSVPRTPPEPYFFTLRRRATIDVPSYESLPSFDPRPSSVQRSSSTSSLSFRRMPGAFPLETRPALQDTGLRAVLLAGNFAVKDRRKRKRTRTVPSVELDTNVNPVGSPPPSPSVEVRDWARSNAEEQAPAFSTLPLSPPLTADDFGTFLSPSADSTLATRRGRKALSVSLADLKISRPTVSSRARSAKRKALMQAKDSLRLARLRQQQVQPNPSPLPLSLISSTKTLATYTDEQRDHHQSLSSLVVAQLLQETSGGSNVAVDAPLVGTSKTNLVVVKRGGRDLTLEDLIVIPPSPAYPFPSTQPIPRPRHMDTTKSSPHLPLPLPLCPARPSNSFLTRSKSLLTGTPEPSRFKKKKNIRGSLVNSNCDLCASFPTKAHAHYDSNIRPGEDAAEATTRKWNGMRRWAKEVGIEESPSLLPLPLYLSNPTLSPSHIARSPTCRSTRVSSGTLLKWVGTSFGSMKRRAA